MPTTALELQERAAKLLRALEAVPAIVAGEHRGKKLAHSMVKSCKEMDAGYRHACASSTPEEFISRISWVARHAKKTKTALMLLTQRDYLPLDDTRELIFEARGLANVFIASRNTAKRHQRERQALKRDFGAR